MLRPRWISPSTLCTRHIRAYANSSTTSAAAQKPPPQRQAPARSIEPTTVTDDATHKAPLSTRPTGGFMLKTYTPRTPGVRHLKRPINDHLWKGRPYRPLTFAKKGHGLGGRNRTGRITVRHRGGGHKRRIRTVDFGRTDPGIHLVERIEHDPGRTAHIALVINKKTEKRSYIVAAEGMRAGDEVQSYRSGIPSELLASMGGTMDPGMLAAKTAVRGNCMPIRMVPLGTQVYNVGSTLGKGAVFCRSAGTYAVVMAKDENRKGTKSVIVRLQSGEMRRVDPNACATIGVASNPHFHFRQLGKAGRARWLGRRPTVRGLAMNASDHPHGGGRGKSKGNRIPSSPWGQPVGLIIIPHYVHLTQQS